MSDPIFFDFKDGKKVRLELVSERDAFDDYKIVAAFLSGHVRTAGSVSGVGHWGFAPTLKLEGYLDLLEVRVLLEAIEKLHVETRARKRPHSTAAMSDTC